MEICSSLRKAKPIFKEEKEFIEKHLNISIPNDCWITGGGTKYIWKDIYSELYLIKFRVVGGMWELLVDNREKLKNTDSLTINETIDVERHRILEKYEHSIKRTVDFINCHKDIKYTISISGGKDSEAIRNLWNSCLERLDFTPTYEFLFFNTTNESACVYKYIKSFPEIKIINPKIGWRKWIVNKKYRIPTIFSRSCCSVYKEGQATKVNDKNKPLVSVLGVRNKESTKRARYEFVMDYNFDKNIFGKSNLPKKWIKLCPIIDWETVDIWLLMLIKKFHISDRYKFGSHRVGCLICPYSNDYEDEILKERFPYAVNWWNMILEKNYNTYDIALKKVSLKEYINGGWKSLKDPVRTITNQEMTNKRISELATLKGISENMAKKFWNNTCKCGKKISPQEIAMFYKTYGRFENTEDNRVPLCKKCYCKENSIDLDTYYETMRGFVKQECNLF